MAVRVTVGFAALLPAFTPTRKTRPRLPLDSIYVFAPHQPAVNLQID
jgi:hypothetical protein